MWECDLCLHTPVDGLTADESYPRTQNFSKGECLMSNDSKAKTIAILTCLKVNERCTGSGCMKAFNHRTAHFAGYDDAEMIAFMRCSRCYADSADITPETDPAFQKKVARLVACNVDIVHIGGHCAKKGGVLCPGMAAQIDYIKSNGMDVVVGTH